MDLNSNDEQILSDLQQAQPQAAPVVPQAPAEPAFNPNEFGFKFRNETVYPKDRSEAIELMQLGRSFRENKPKWEQDRQTLASYEQKKSIYQGYDALSEALDKNPQFRSELQQLAEKYSGQPTQENTQTLPPEIQAKLQKIDEFESWRADNELKSELDNLQQKYPSYDWKADTGEGTLRQQLLKYMNENHVYDSDIALRAMMYGSDIQRTRMDAERKAADDAARQRKLGIVPAGTQPAPQQGPRNIDPRQYSYDQLEDVALQSLGRA
jgi:hypothetical protein